MSIQTPAPSVTILASGTPAPSVTLMWAETPFSVLLTLGGYTSTAPPSPVLTFAQSVQLALQWVGVARRAAPKVKLAPLIRPIPLLRRLRPLPQGSPHYHLAFINCVPLRAPHVTPAFCAHEVGKDSLKCSTCSKWVPFCSSLTRANFCKICVPGSTMDWNCPACLNGDLASPTHQQAFPRPVSPVPPPPTPPPTCSNVMDSSLPSLPF